MNISELSLKRPVLATVMNIAIVLFGIVGFSFLGISFLIGGCVLKYFVSENVTGIFLGIYPIVAYLFLIIRSNKYSIGQYKKTNRIGFNYDRI